MMIHPLADVEPGAQLGPDVVIWRWTHVRPSAVIGRGSHIGQGCYIEGMVGEDCRIQNGVSIYRGVTLGDRVFVGPAAVFTNDLRPRARPPLGGWQIVPTTVGIGASIGANVTIRAGVTIGAYAMIAAGAVVARNVLPRALIIGPSAETHGWVCQCGERLFDQCLECGDDLKCLP